MNRSDRQANPSGVVHHPVPHDSAHKHVAGTAHYVDDLPEPDRLLHAYVGVSEFAHGRITELDLHAVQSAPGVVAVITAADIPGSNEISPIHADDERALCDGLVEFAGQPLFAVAAHSRDQARRAARLARIRHEPLPATLELQEALEQEQYVLPPHHMRRGEPETALQRATHRLQGEVHTGGQDHLYLEGQVCMAIPQEDGDMLLNISSQHPTEIQQTIARALGVDDNAITVEVRRMGGAFGGKETQAAQWAVIAAVLARHTGRPVKLRLDRDDDMRSTGKRHDFLIRYDVGFDDDGRIEALAVTHAARCGMSADLSGAICDRAMFHADNAYYLPHVQIDSYRCKTHTVSNTAFRGFGGPQGMLGMERVIDEIAHYLGKDPLEVRRLNFYGGEGRDLTPYHMQVEDNIIQALVEELAASSGYPERRREIDAFNRDSPVIRRGIALTPVKFGISFTTTHLNQAGALVHIYRDGSIHLNHGGTEMGQGLMTKVAQVVADELMVDLRRVKVTATHTGKVPNTSATAASSGSDMNGMAALAAARTLRERLTAFAAESRGLAPEAVEFRHHEVRIGEETLRFEQLVEQAWAGRVSLSATGFYRTPRIHYDRDRARGRPFLYFAYGAAVSEVEVDTLTGEHRLRRVDILHDTGRSLNPAIDLGQIEGGFVQGLGWLTSEELWWDDAGRLRTHAPSTYKIPTIGDLPEAFHVNIWARGDNDQGTIHRSKAVGEPPLMLALSVHSALTQALAGTLGGQRLPGLDAPATPERILRCLQSAP